MLHEEMVTLYQEAKKILWEEQRVLFYFRRQQFYQGLLASKRAVDTLLCFSDLFLKNIDELNGEAPYVCLEEYGSVLRQLQSAQEISNYVWLADLYELQLQPVLIQTLERIVGVLDVWIDERLVSDNINALVKENPMILLSCFDNEQMEQMMCLPFSDECMDVLVSQMEQVFARNIVIEPTSCGEYTIARIEQGQSCYFHTNGLIMAEAITQAKEYLDQGKECYTFYGMGLGYQYLEMLMMDPNVEITVYETNRDLLLCAFLFSPLSQLLHTGRFHLVYDPTGKRLTKSGLKIDQTEGFYIFYPALRGIGKPELRVKLEQYFLEESSVRGQSSLMQSNFVRNVKQQFSPIRELLQQLHQKTVVLVAAGPSLDQEMERLKQVQNSCVILAVGTVFKKLIQANIRPDYVIILDANIGVMRQLEDMEMEEIPLIYLSTAYAKAVSQYPAKKYLLCQEGYLEAEQLARQNNWPLFETGGSVSTLAFDLCLKAGVMRLICVGLDLAFPGDLDHASNTLLAREVQSDTGITVLSNDGKQVKTSRNLKIYLEWLQNRIQQRTDQEKNSVLINTSKEGAKITGMEYQSFSKIIF